MKDEILADVVIDLKEFSKNKRFDLFKLSMEKFILKNLDLSKDYELHLVVKEKESSRRISTILVDKDEPSGI